MLVRRAQLGSSQPPPSEKVGGEAHRTFGVVESGSQHGPQLTSGASMIKHTMMLDILDRCRRIAWTKVEG